MKLKTRIVAWLLATVMMVSAMPATVFATDSYPEIPTTYGTELFLETFDGETHSLGGSTNTGCAETLQDGYWLLTDGVAGKQFYRDALFAKTSTETAAMFNIKFCLDDINTKFRLPVMFGTTTSVTDGLTIQDGAIYRNNDADNKVTLTEGAWHTLTVVANYATNTAYYYLDGVYFSQFTDAAKIAQDMQFYGVRAFRHKNDSGLACEIRFDEISAYGVVLAEAPVEPEPTAEPTAEPTPVPTEAPVAAPEVRPNIPAELGTAVFAETFEDEEYTEGFSFAGAGWDRGVMNGYALVEKNAVKQGYFDATTPRITNGTAAVYQTDFYLADLESQFRVMLFTEATGESILDRFYVTSGNLVYGEYTKALEADTWYTLSVVFDYENGRAYYYLNEECFGILTDETNISMESQLLKVRVNATEAYMANNFVVCFDNVAVYEATLTAELPVPTPEPTPMPTPEPTPEPTAEPTQAPAAAPEVRPNIPAELGNVVFAETFEDEEYAEGFAFAGAGWARSVMNGYALVEKAAAKQGYFDVDVAAIENGTAAVYQTDFYLADIESPFRVMLFTEATGTGTTFDKIYVCDGNLVYGEYTKALEADTWYTFSAMFDYVNSNVYYYLNDECFATVSESEWVSVDSQLIKVRVNYADKLNDTTGYLEKNFVACFDNVAVYEATMDEYTVVFADEDGSEISKESVAYGAMPVEPEAPVKEATAQYTYTFNGWDKEVVAVTEDVTYTATYTSTVNEYEITFVDEDGSEIKKETLAYGAEIVAPADPTKKATAQYTYTFNGWSPEVAKTVTGNATYTAQYKETVRAYVITFRNEDGSEIKSEPVAYGEQPTCEEPTKAEDVYATYTFAGWTPAVVAVEGEATYTATYTKTPKTYTVTWVVNGEETTVPYEAGKMPEAPVVENYGDVQYTYTFTGWDKDFVEVTEDVTYKAQFTQTVNEYMVTWVDLDGSVLLTESYEYGQTPEYKGAASKYGEIKGWSPEVAEVTGDATYTVESDYTGILQTVEGNLYYYMNGKMQKNAGLVEVDGKLYYVHYSGKIVAGANQTVTEAKANGLMPAGTYFFKEDGSMRQANKFAGEVKADENGVLWYYVDGEVCKNVGLVNLDGKLYYVHYSGKVVMNSNQTVAEAKTNGFAEAGTYYFMEDGVMLTNDLKVYGGNVGEDGYYYVRGELTKNVGLVKIGEDFYYVHYSGKVVQNGYQTVTEAKANGFTQYVGVRKFVDGVMVK